MLFWRFIQSWHDWISLLTWNFTIMSRVINQIVSNIIYILWDYGQKPQHKITWADTAKIWFNLLWNTRSYIALSWKKKLLYVCFLLNLLTDVWTQRGNVTPPSWWYFLNWGIILITIKDHWQMLLWLFKFKRYWHCRF